MQSESSSMGHPVFAVVAALVAAPVLAVMLVGMWWIILPMCAAAGIGYAIDRAEAKEG